ncbi:hypothetical protein UAW_03110 [Enterococcus haemoperoxidus ATCC BAA-382]|uniref:Uncharacterized protein n=1 Tax=Enterococcus haemoperoxidus ATCC BAA-382 TaxID=1158608 RepID=R2SAD5_9ENTE|nr:DUF916 and DUF3324 domain-containing protein [Enterococcus haemoperoxidus]EOH92445.1 hypothetical protein UAW_03110 [Enterococcus haemoperoxidus ATCC BAA-382]EOT61811.1 hypothetical protein I583_00793 [Enterococcus haemoperoxidus ATCC BAA-382]
MKKRIGIGLFFSLYIVALLGFSTPAHANLQFTYETVKPENQQGDFEYFNLLMQPGQKQTVQVMLSNRADEEQTIEVGLNGAKTNSNGVLEFGPSAIKNDASLKYDFKDLVKGPKEMTLGPNETRPLNIEISMPETNYIGKIVGGIHLKSKPTKKEEEENKKATGVINEYAFVIGMVLSESDTVIKPELSLNKVYAGLANYRNSIFANFSNTSADFVNNMTVEMEVTKKGSEAVLYDIKRADMRMAPNSMIDFPLEMNGDQMEAGDYKAHIVVTSGEEKWTFDKAFKITNEEADKYNAQDVTLIQERGIDWKLIALIVGGVFVTFLAIFFIVRSMNKKKNSKKRGKKKRK